MKIYRPLMLLVFLILSRGGSPVFCEDGASDPNQAFYRANLFYEKRDYAKAAGEYEKIIDMGVENGRLYYNLGNAFFKLGETGKAILYYEKAQRLMPQDGDLKSNLAYARSMVPEILPERSIRRTLNDALKRPFRDFNLNALSIAAMATYLVFIALIALFLLNPALGKKIKIPLIIFAAVFALSLTAFGVRYFDEEIIKQGAIIQKSAECKYEPIDQSTTYFTLPEGSIAVILRTRDGWSKVRRRDGHVGWIKSGAIGEI